MDSGPRMGLTLDEPKLNDERIEVKGLSFILASEVADMIRFCTGNSLWTIGQSLSLGEGVSIVLSGKRLLLVV